MTHAGQELGLYPCGLLGDLLRLFELSGLLLNLTLGVFNGLCITYELLVSPLPTRDVFKGTDIAGIRPLRRIDRCRMTHNTADNVVRSHESEFIGKRLPFMYFGVLGCRDVVAFCWI